jgi:uncharacterized phage protein gp47/JayE
MAAYETKEKTDILRHALQKLQKKTPVTSIGPGSVARGLAETVINELGDFYSIMDYNVAMTLISSAQGRALDLMGELYSVQRKQIGQVATLEQQVGAFYFYIDEPYNEDILIPQGTLVSTDSNNYIGTQYTYVTTSAAQIRAGRLRVFVPIAPDFADSVFTSGANTITRHNIDQPLEQPTLKCTNPKTIAPQVGYETDENYRTRIIKAVRTSAGGTTDAIRFAGLSVPGVREVSIRNTPYGLGSVEALVVPEERVIAAQVLADSIKKLQSVRPAGVKLYVREPDYTSVDIIGSIILRNDLVFDSSGVARRAEIGVLRYLNRLLPGKQFIYNQLIQSIMDSSDTILDVSIQTLRVDNVEVLRRNYTPKEDQQLIPGEIDITIATSA